MGGEGLREVGEGCGSWSVHSRRFNIIPGLHVLDSNSKQQRPFPWALSSPTDPSSHAQLWSSKCLQTQPELKTMDINVWFFFSGILSYNYKMPIMLVQFMSPSVGKLGVGSSKITELLWWILTLAFLVASDSSQKGYSECSSRTVARIWPETNSELEPGHSLP